MFNAIRLQNFKNHRDTNIELKNLTALTGTNGSGKTSVLDAFRLMAGVKSLTSSILPELWLAERHPERFVLQGRPFWRLRFIANHEGSLLGATMTSDADKLIENWHWKGEDKKANHIPLVLEFMEGCAEFHRSENRFLTEPSHIEAVPPRLGGQGQGLASMVAFLMTSEPEAYVDVLRDLKRVIPGIRQVRTRPAKISRVEQGRKGDENGRLRELVGHELVFDMTSGVQLNASNMGIGALRALAMLTVAHQPCPPRLLMFDDIEEGLHPDSQLELMRILREMSSDRDDLQILLTTRSSFIVDGLEPSMVWVCAANEEGVAMVQRLSDHPLAASAIPAQTPGAFLRQVGESWLLD